MKRRLGQAAAIALVGLALVVGRVVWSSRAELRAADGAGDRDEQLSHLGRAARLYAPGNPYSRRALDRLEAQAREAEQRGDRAFALAAWRELRASVLATRAVYHPNADRLATADARIADLAAALESPSVDPTADAAARRAWHAARLAHSDEPSIGWSLVALLGFAGWIAAALLFLFRGLDDADRLRARAALGSALALAVSLALFLLGLARA